MCYFKANFLATRKVVGKSRLINFQSKKLIFNPFLPKKHPYKFKKLISQLKTHLNWFKKHKIKLKKNSLSSLVNFSRQDKE
jgi:hypothetical protein